MLRIATYYSLIFGLVFFSNCTAETPKSKEEIVELKEEKIMEVQLFCIPASDHSTDIPHHDIYFQIGDKKTRIADTQVCAEDGFSEVVQKQIPEHAIAAVGGYWAGLGRYFYATNENNRPTVFEIRAYEEEPDTLDVIEVAFFENGRFGRKD